MILKIYKILALFSLLILLSPHFEARAQNVLDDIKEEDVSERDVSGNAPALVSETIKVIAPSKKIFILTNENQSFSKGDFISLLLANKLVCRAIVAKTTDEKLSGIKIVKIYNTTLWKQLGPGKEVLVLKGDDSYYINLANAPKNAEKAEAEDLKLQEEEDLFNSTTFDGDDLSLSDNTKRLIKTDNILSAGVGLIPGKDVEGASQRYSHLNASWGYQVADNVWAELGFGSNIVKDFPSEGIDARMNNFTTKVKFTFNAPFYSYFMPYVGYQVISVDSPDAGVSNGEATPTPEELQLEVERVDSLKKNSIIFGATVLKRLVPGWFIRLDVGTDIINGGLSLEF